MKLKLLMCFVVVVVVFDLFQDVIRTMKYFFPPLHVTITLMAAKD